METEQSLAAARQQVVNAVRWLSGKATATEVCDALVQHWDMKRPAAQLAIQRAIENGVVLCAKDWSLSVAAQEGSGVEGLRSDDAPATIEDIDAAMRRGREIGSMIVGSADLRGPAQPVAWRVKDFADGWILCHSLAEAQREADGAGNLIQPLYLASRLAGETQDGLRLTIPQSVEHK
jgi:hypothetical protein